MVVLAIIFLSFFLLFKAVYMEEKLVVLFFRTQKLDAEIVGFDEARLFRQSEAHRTNHLSLIQYELNGETHCVSIFRDREDFIGKHIDVAYYEKKDLIVRKKIQKTYYKDSLFIQIMYGGVFVFLICYCLRRHLSASISRGSIGMSF